MRFLKVSLWVFWVGYGVWLWVGCGADPRGRFEGEVRGIIAEAQNGKYLELEWAMSEGLKGRVRSEGWEPKATLAVVARRDREEGASYQLRDVPKFEGSYAEAEIGRVAGGKEKRMVLPFIWENGKWRVAAAYRDGRSWEGEDF